MVIRRLDGRGTLTLLALLEPIALAIHLQDVDVVGQTVEQAAGEPLGGKDAGPFIKGQIAGHQGRAAFVALATPATKLIRLVPITSNGSG